MKYYEIKTLSTKDLKSRLAEESEGLENLRFQKSIGQLENFKSLENTRKLIARINTVLKERESAKTESAETESSDKKDK